MKKRLLIVVGAIIMLLLGVVIWKCAHTDAKNPGSIHELDHVLTFAEQKGADYAADQLNYLIVYSYTKHDLHEKWGTPSETIADANEDVWQLSEEYQLVMNYDTEDQVRKIEIQCNINSQSAE